MSPTSSSSNVPSNSTPPAPRPGVNMDIVFAVLVMLVAAAAIVVSRNFPGTGLSTDIGSARFPLIYSVVLLVLGAILIVQSIRKRRGPTQAVAPAAFSDAAGSEPPDYRKSFSGILASVLCLVAMPFAGYALTSAVYLCFLMWLLGMRHKALNPILALAITATIYFTFASALNVPLPIGSFFE